MNKPEPKKFEEVFPGFYRKGSYIFEECPWCLMEMSARFVQNFTLFECSSCHQILLYEEFVQKLAPTVTYGKYIDKLLRPDAMPEGLIDIATYVPGKDDRLIIPSGFKALDRLTGGFRAGEMTILGGKRGEGKSTICGQFFLNAIQAGFKVFMYSGEFSAAAFQNWIMLQAAGPAYVRGEEDIFGEVEYHVEQEYAEPHIKAWMRGKQVLYDNKVIRKDEHNTILDRARIAANVNGVDLIIIDNLKTARFKAKADSDHYRRQAEFAKDMLALAVELNCHVILVAHPKKAETGDANDNISGLSDIPDIAHNVITISRIRDRERHEFNCDAILELSKNRRRGKEAKMKLDFSAKSKRFKLQGEPDTRYGWEDEI